MIPYDIHNKLSFLRGVSPVTQTNSDAAFVSQIISMANLMSLTWVIALGTLSDAGFTTVVLLEESDASDMTGAVAVADADMLPSGTGQEAAAAFTEASDDLIRLLSYVGTKAFIRLTITPTGNAAGNIPIAVLAIGEKRLQGTAN